MKGKQFYFVEIDSPHIGHFDEGWCYTEAAIRQTMEEEEIDEIRTFRAVREKDSDAFYCKDVGEAYLKEDSPCGKNCIEYTPRNGKNGICKHHRGVWTSTDEEVVFRRSDTKPSKGLEPLEGSSGKEVSHA